MAVAPTSSEAELLKTRVPINTLSDEDRAVLLEKINVERLRKGELLFRQGDTDSKNVYLLSGKVDLLLDNKVVDTITDNLETARFALAHQFPRKFSARASSPVEFVSIDSQLLSGLLTGAQADNNAVVADEADDEDWMTQLLRSSVVQHIPPANIQNVMMRMERVDVKAGEEIIKQGDEGSYFFLINKGKCAVTLKRNDTAEAEELARLGPGDNFGEEALLSGGPRACSVTMLTDGALFRLNKEDFITFIKRPLTKNVDYKKACEIVEAGGAWLDVRDEDDRDNSPEGSINIPLHSLRFQVDSLEFDKQYVVCCADGAQSSVAAFLLLEHGIDVAVLKGGISSISKADQAPEEQEPASSQSDSATQSDTAEDISKLIQERDEAQKQVALLEQSLAETKKKYEEVQGKLVANVATLKQTVQDLQEKLTAAQAGGASQGDDALMQRIAELESEKTEQDKQIKQLESAKKQLNAEMEILMEASEENDKAGIAEVTQLKEQIKELQQQLKAAKETG